MSWRFRKTFKVLPGVKLNLTRYGLSATVGAAPFSVNVGPRGVYSNVSIPGTGLWNRERLDIPSSQPPVIEPPPTDRRGVPPPLPLAPSIPPIPSPSPVTEIRSASTELLGSESMAQLRRLLKEAYDERDTLAKEISSAAREADINENRYRSWERGVLLRRVFSRSFARRKDAHETAQAKCQELDEQLRLTTLATQIEIEREQAEPYYRMRDDFAALSECRKIWDTLDRRAINRVAERSAAHEAVTRELVSFSLSSCDLIQWEQKVPHLPNRTGGDMYIYPGFVLYRASKQAFALIDSREVTLTFRAERFIEVEPVPSDTKVVGHAWSKSNKDGSPDRRFRDNYQIPLVLYGSLTFTSPSGLHEEFQLSSPKLAERFSKAWNVFQASFASTAQERKTTRSVMPFVQTPRNATERLDVTTVFARFKAAQATFVRNVPGGRIHHSEVTAFMLAVLEFIDAVKGQVENSNSSPTVKARFRRAVHGVEAARSHVEECISGGQTNLTESLVAYINSVGSFLNAATESGCQW